MGVKLSQFAKKIFCFFFESIHFSFLMARSEAREGTDEEAQEEFLNIYLKKKKKEVKQSSRQKTGAIL